MDFLFIKIILFALIQSLTEFLPVSSSGHLVLLHNIFTDNVLNSIGFDIALHAGSLLAIILYFFKDIIKIVKDFFHVLFSNTRLLKNDLGFLLIIGSIPAIIVGYFFGDFIEYFFRKPLSVAIALICGAILFVLAEKFYKPRKALNNISLSNSIFVGFSQCLALIPGVSRSGMTIVSSMFSGLERKDAAKFSFLLAMPVIFGAFCKQFLAGIDIDSDILLLGIALSFIFSLFALKILMLLLKKSTGLYIFAIYRILLAIAILIFLI